LLTGFFWNKHDGEERSAYNDVKNEQRPSSAKPGQLQPIRQFIRKAV